MGQGGTFVFKNNTPYRWRRSYQHSYQMNAFDFPEFIDPHSEKPVYVEYSEGIFETWTDDAGEVVYAIETGSATPEFEVKFNYLNVVVNFKSLSTVSPPLGPGSTFDIGGWKHDGHMVFNLCGTLGNFFILAPADWMRASLPIWGSRTLRQICMPGSHDAGMSEFGASTAFAAPRNTQTQYVSIGEQLKLGVRFFDIRIVISGGMYFTGHYGDTGNSFTGWQGANGQSLDDIIKNINDFTSNQVELIILQISHPLNTDVGEPHYRDHFTKEEWYGLLDKLMLIGRRYTEPNPNFMQVTLNEFLKNQKSSVIILIEGDNLDEALNSPKYKDKGFYKSDCFPLFDDYANKDDYEDMKRDQLNKMNDPNNHKDKCFVLSWTLTQTSEEAANPFGISILDLAKKANEHLGDAINACTPTVFPNVFLIDGISSNVPLFETVMQINFLVTK